MTDIIMALVSMLSPLLPANLLALQLYVDSSPLFRVSEWEKQWIVQEKKTEN